MTQSLFYTFKFFFRIFVHNLAFFLEIIERISPTISLESKNVKGPMAIASTTFSLISTVVFTIIHPQGNVITDFFNNIFYHPSDNKTALMISGMVCLGLVAGIIYLVKRNCDKRHGIT